MRLFMGAWALVAVVLSVLLLPAPSTWLWLFAIAVCGVLLACVTVFRFHRVPVWAAVVGMVLAIGTTAVGLADTQTAGWRGYPFGWLARGSDDLDLPGRVRAPSFAGDAGWAVDVPVALIDLAMWGVFGLALMVGFSVVVRQAGRGRLLRTRHGSTLDSGNA